MGGHEHVLPEVAAAAELRPRGHVAEVPNLRPVADVDGGVDDRARVREVSDGHREALFAPAARPEKNAVTASTTSAIEPAVISG